MPCYPNTYEWAFFVGSSSVSVWTSQTCMNMLPCALNVCLHWLLCISSEEISFFNTHKCKPMWMCAHPDRLLHHFLLHLSILTLSHLKPLLFSLNLLHGAPPPSIPPVKSFHIHTLSLLCSCRHSVVHPPLLAPILPSPILLCLSSLSTSLY